MVTDAVEAILMHSPNFQSVLRRKIVTRDLLFQYLHENKVSVALPITKPELIDIVREYWNLKDSAPISTVENEILPELNVMAVKFTEWFYTMMNCNEPISVDHFWRDGKLKLQLISSSQTVEEEVVDVNEIVKSLFKTKCEYKLYFNPNLLSDGVKGEMNPHGLVVILACGTLHSNNICVGVFEQIFMLARDPFSDNNWKIKNTTLKLHSKTNVHKPPSLCDTNLSSSLSILPNC